jgi:quinoprotein dehydrogenase-associated probable ABC transporter substrate-binding protein
MTRRRGKAFAAPQLARALIFLAVAGAVAAEPLRELRVCGDPNNLPFSNDRLEGFENKIADLIAKEMNASVRYTWLSHRGSFIRKTLTAGKCDLILNFPGGSEFVLATKPYYSSSYVFVYAKDRKLGLRSFDDPVLRGINIGIHAFGEEGASPAAIALGSRGIVGRIVGFTILESAENPPGKIIDAVSAGQIDVAIVWGPFAGYFARRQPILLEVVPVSPGDQTASVPFVYDISMGVRRGDTAFRDELEGVLERRRVEIRKILDDYGVPLVDVPALALGQ